MILLTFLMIVIHDRMQFMQYWIRISYPLNLFETNSVEMPGMKTCDMLGGC